MAFQRRFKFPNRCIASTPHREIPEPNRVIVDEELLKLYPSSDGMMHDECMVGVGGTSLKWDRAVRDVPDTAQLHETVYERLAMKSVRNYKSFGP